MPRRALYKTTLRQLYARSGQSFRCYECGNPTFGRDFKSFSIEREDLPAFGGLPAFRRSPLREVHAYKTLEKSKV